MIRNNVVAKSLKIGYRNPQKEEQSFQVLFQFIFVDQIKNPAQVEGRKAQTHHQHGEKRD